VWESFQKRSGPQAFQVGKGKRRQKPLTLPDTGRRTHAWGQDGALVFVYDGEGGGKIKQKKKGGLVLGKGGGGGGGKKGKYKRESNTTKLCPEKEKKLLSEAIRATCERKSGPKKGVWGASGAYRGGC